MNQEPGALQKMGSKISKLFNVSGDERLLLERRRRRRNFRGHAQAYAVITLAFFALMAAAHSPIEVPVVFALLWGVAVALHGLRYRNWLADFGEEVRAAEMRLRLSGNPDQLRLLDAGSSPTTADPLLQRCEQAAEETKARLTGSGSAEVEVLAVIDSGLERVRELLNRRADILQVLHEVRPEQLVSERARLEDRLRESRDADARALYQSQLDMLRSRMDKTLLLQGLLERSVAFAESYLAALTNLRMDAARLKVADLPQGQELVQLMKPVREMERQVENMRAAAAEVAQTVNMLGR